MGAVFAVTFTVKLAVAVKPPPSVTVKVTVFAPRVALQLAAITAEIVPLLLVTFVTVKPVGMLEAVTVKLFAAVRSSLTVATLDALAVLPCCRVTDAAAEIVGAPLTVSDAVLCEVAPQLSVAVTVSV